MKRRKLLVFSIVICLAVFCLSREDNEQDERFPNYRLTFSLITDEGEVAGRVSGEFITRNSYTDFFNAN